MAMQGIEKRKLEPGRCSNGARCLNPAPRNRPTILRGRGENNSGTCSYCQGGAPSLRASNLLVSDVKVAGASSPPIPLSGSTKDEGSSRSPSLKCEEGGFPSPDWLDLSYGGKDVASQVQAFLGTSSVGNDMKAELSAYLVALKTNEMAKLALSSIALTGVARLRRIWRPEADQGQPTPSPGGPTPLDSQPTGRASLGVTGHCQLAITDACRTMSASQVDGELVISANPLFSGVLDDASLGTVLAHEYHHHSAGHNRLRGELRAAFLEVLAGRLAIADRAEGMDLRRALDDHIDRAIDCVTNRAIGATNVNIDLPPRQDRTGGRGLRGRVLFAAAVALGDGVQEAGSEELTIPLQTDDRTAFEFGIEIAPDDTPGEILEKLLAADPRFT